MTLEQEIAQLEWAMRTAERDCEADNPAMWDRGGWVDYARSLLQFNPQISTEAKREFARMQGIEWREEYKLCRPKQTARKPEPATVSYRPVTSALPAGCIHTAGITVTAVMTDVPGSRKSQAEKRMTEWQASGRARTRKEKRAGRSVPRSARYRTMGQAHGISVPHAFTSAVRASPRKHSRR